MTTHQVGERLGIAGATVSRRLRKAGVKARKPGAPLPVDDMDILRLRSEGLLWQRIAEEVGMTPTGARSRFYKIMNETGYDDPLPAKE